jgi:pimeloyl-ACP methyl ester carboxylesterase
MKRVLRVVLLALLALLACALLAALAVFARNEWLIRQPPNAPAPIAVAPGDQRPTLILLHGAGLNGRMWDAVRRELNPAWRVIALDLPGHGARRNEAFTLPAATEAIAQAARTVAPAPVLLVGDSLGGYSAMAAAAAVPPEQLRGLMIGGVGATSGHRQMLEYLRDAPVIAATALVVDSDDFVARALALLGLNAQDARNVVDAGTSITAVPLAVRALLYVDFRPKLAAVSQPVLIVNGSGDTRALAQEDALLAAAPNATRYRFENTGHGVSMRRSAEFAAQLNAFAVRAFAVSDRPKP